MAGLCESEEIVAILVVVSEVVIVILIIVLFFLMMRVALGVFLLCPAARSHAVDALEEVAVNSLLVGGSSGFAKAAHKFWFLRVIVQVAPENQKSCS